MVDEMTLPEILVCPDCGREDNFPIKEDEQEEREKKLRAWAERASWWFDKDGKGYCAECAVPRMRPIVARVARAKRYEIDVRKEIGELMIKNGELEADLVEAVKDAHEAWSHVQEESLRADTLQEEVNDLKTAAESDEYAGPYPLGPTPFLTGKDDYPIVMLPGCGSVVAQEDGSGNVLMGPTTLDASMAFAHNLPPVKKTNPFYRLNEEMRGAVEDLLERGALPGSIRIDTTDKPDADGKYHVTVSALAPDANKVLPGLPLPGGFTPRTEPSKIKATVFDGDYTPEQVEEINKRWDDPGFQESLRADDGLPEACDLCMKDAVHFQNGNKRCEEHSIQGPDDELSDIPDVDLIECARDQLRRACLDMGAPSGAIRDYSKEELVQAIINRRKRARESEQLDCPNCPGFVLRNHEGGKRTCDNCKDRWPSGEDVRKQWEEKEELGKIIEDSSRRGWIDKVKKEG